MEFFGHEQLEQIEVVDSFDGNLVALPLPFPDAAITPGNVQLLQVQTDDGGIAEGLCVVSAHHIFMLGKKLKDAIFGDVYCGCVVERLDNSHIFKVTSNFVAVKVILKDRMVALAGRTQEDPMNEIAALQFIGSNHPNVMGQICCIEDDAHFFSIMNFCDGGELYDFVGANSLTEAQARHIFCQFLDGLAYLQSIGICHRDISLENLLLTRDMQCVIIDMGMCLRLPRLPENDNVLLIPRRNPSGKKNYVAPEVLADENPINGLLVDMWAAGVVLFFLLTGVPPVEYASPLDPRFRMIRDGKLKNLLLQWNVHISEDAMDLLQKMLAVEPSQRLGIDAIRRHPWVAML